jgi:hypothetical protein
MENKKIIKNLNLAEGERIRFIIRRYLLIYWWRIVLVVVLLLLPFFLLYPLFQWQPWGPFVFGIILALGLIGLLRLYISWYFNCLIVTNQRVIDFDQRGPLDRTVSEAPLERIDDITYRRKGIFQSLLNYGVIQYSIPPGRAKIIIKGVRNPQTICQQIISLTEDARQIRGHIKDQPIDSVNKLKDLLWQMKNELGDEDFTKIVKEVE